MRSKTDLRLDLFVLQTNRNQKEQARLMELLTGTFNTDLYEAIKDNREADQETRKYL